MNPEPKNVSDEKIIEGIERLKKSQRGAAALAAFYKMLEDGGDGLDPGNWEALLLLCDLGARGHGYLLMPVLKSMHGQHARVWGCR